MLFMNSASETRFSKCLRSVVVQHASSVGVHGLVHLNLGHILFGKESQLLLPAALQDLHL